MKRYIAIGCSGTVIGLLAAVPTAASAKVTDDIPDGWEHAHHLSLSINQANLDQDHDGLKNKNEFKDQTNPRLKDSDRDGVKDGDEDADHDGASNREEQESDEKGEDNDDQGEDNDDQGDDNNERGDNENNQGDNNDDQGDNNDD